MQMIIKSLRVRSTSGVNRLIRHLKSGTDNDNVAFLRGTPADLRDMQHDASARDMTYSIRHWIVAPHEITSRQQMKQILELLAEEFAFNPSRAVVVEHCKKRSVEGASNIHWHVLVGETDPATGRVLKSSFDRVIHELIARISEHTLGHSFVRGKHTKTVIKALHKRKLACIANRLETFVGKETCVRVEAFTHAQHQEKKRLGIDLPALRQAVKTAVASATSRDDLTRSLAASELTLLPGEKANTWIVRNSTGALVGALHRLAGWRKSEINALLAKAETIKTMP